MSEYISKGIKDKDGNIARFEPPAPSGNKLGGISASNVEQIRNNETNISTLAKHVTGELTDSDFSEDSTVAMTKPVPTGMADYAAIKVIGGKTVKTKNLLKPQNGLKEATVNGITFTPVFDSNGYLEYVTANGTATANASFIVTKLKEDISGYILSLGLSQESVSYGIACELGVSPWTTYQTIKGSGEKTVPSITYTDTINVYVQVLKDATAKNVKFYPMLRKSGTSSIYEPYHEDLWNAATESVVSTSADGTTKTTLLMPDAIKSLPDWGCSVDDVCNYVDFETGIYHRCVKSIKLSNYNFVSASGLRWVTSTVIDNNLSTEDSNATRRAFISDTLTFDNNVIADISKTYDFTAALYTDKKLYCMLPSTITTASDAKDVLNDTNIIVKLATEELIDISDMLHPIRCESGGTITFTNEHSLDVPNSIVYKKEVSLNS